MQKKSALQWRRNKLYADQKHSASLCDNVLTSVVCVCLWWTRQLSKRETIPLEWLSWKPTFYLEGGCISIALQTPHFHSRHRWNVTHRQMHTYFKIQKGEANFVMLYISLQVGIFVLNQSTAVVYLYNAPWWMILYCQNTICVIGSFFGLHFITPPPAANRVMRSGGR